MGVAVEAALGIAVRGLVAGQVPDDERLVARAGEEHVRAGRCQSRAQCGPVSRKRTSRGKSRGT